jgi:hypothetical protein
LRDLFDGHSSAVRGREVLQALRKQASGETAASPKKTASLARVPGYTGREGKPITGRMANADGYAQTSIDG